MKISSPIRSERRALLGLFLVAALSLAACERTEKNPKQEPQQAQPAAPALPATRIDRIFTRADAARLLSEPRPATKLAGVPTTDTYDSTYFAPPSGGLGVALQWWKLPTLEEARVRFDKELAGHPGATPVPNVGTASFVATTASQVAFGLFDEKASSVLVLTCGRSACPVTPEGQVEPATWAKLVELMVEVQRRVESAPQP